MIRHIPDRLGASAGAAALIMPTISLNHNSETHRLVFSIARAYASRLERALHEALVSLEYSTHPAAGLHKRYKNSAHQIHLLIGLEAHHQVPSLRLSQQTSEFDQAFLTLISYANEAIRTAKHRHERTQRKPEATAYPEHFSETLRTRVTENLARLLTEDPLYPIHPIPDRWFPIQDTPAHAHLHWVHSGEKRPPRPNQSAQPEIIIAVPQENQSRFMTDLSGRLTAAPSLYEAQIKRAKTFFTTESPLPHRLVLSPYKAPFEERPSLPEAFDPTTKLYHLRGISMLDPSKDADLPIHLWKGIMQAIGIDYPLIPKPTVSTT